MAPFPSFWLWRSSARLKLTCNQKTTQTRPKVSWVPMLTFHSIKVKDRGMGKGKDKGDQVKGKGDK